MLPVSFPGCNCDFGPPENMTDEECTTINGMKYVNKNNIPFILFALKPSYEDIISFNVDMAKEIAPRFYLRICSHLIAPFQMLINETAMKVYLEGMGVDNAGYAYTCYKVELTKEDVSMLNDGGCIFYNTFGETIFPFACFTLDENNEGNI
jgi:hypothetical protein